MIDGDGTEPRDAEQYFASRPGSPTRPRIVRAVLAGRPVELATDAGVFSADRLDPGTRILLDKAPAPPGSGVFLDLGCGYGPLTLALALARPTAEVWGVDVNTRALALARRNADAAGVGDQVRLVTPEEVPVSLRVDLVWSNPPIRVGKPELHRLLAAALGTLSPSGYAALVVSRHLGADSLSAWLGRQGWVVRRVASAQGYRVLVVEDPGSSTDGPRFAPGAYDR